MKHLKSTECSRKKDVCVSFIGLCFPSSWWSFGSPGCWILTTMMTWNIFRPVWGLDPSDNVDFETWTPWKDVARLLVKIRIRKKQLVFIYGYESHLQSKLFTHLQLEHNYKLMNCQDDNSKNHPSSNDDGRNPRYNTVNFHKNKKSQAGSRPKNHPKILSINRNLSHSET